MNITSHEVAIDQTPLNGFKKQEKQARLENSLFSPNLYAHYLQVAEMFAKSSLVPKDYEGKPSNVFIAMEMGYQLGLPMAQALQDISIINGRPCLWGDGLLALCLNHPDCVSIDEEPIIAGGKVMGYTCTVKRKNHAIHAQQFTIDDANRAGLIERKTRDGKPVFTVWKTYPSRMLQMRARSLALRDKFADALRGLRVAEVEKEDGHIFNGESEVINKSRAPSSKTQMLKEILKVEEEVVITEEDLEAQILKERIQEILEAMDEKGFDEARRFAALDRFKVRNLEELTLDQAEVFLEKVKLSN